MYLLDDFLSVINALDEHILPIDAQIPQVIAYHLDNKDDFFLFLFFRHVLLILFVYNFRNRGQLKINHGFYGDHKG
jgi:hypothetical protein